MAKKGAAGTRQTASRSPAASAAKPAPKPKSAAKPKAVVKPKAAVKPKVAAKPKVAIKPKVAVQLKVAAKPKAVAKPKVAVAKKAAPAARKGGAGKSLSVLHAASASWAASYGKNLPAPVVAAMPAPVRKDSRLAQNWKKKPAQELTDAEVIAMPDGEYMNEAQMAFFRHRLVRLKSDILDNAGQTTENLREDTVVVPDPADRATIEEEHALELRTRDRERKLLKKIEQSIIRIDAGDYGYCDETGEPIGVPRLLARPTATLSLEAQQRRELKQKMFGD
ncbi:MAG: RNA polymerase-binding protein DksA [Burkholderiaceae bacterium]|nr:RNA polymerase-binding protein DksA [Burkholderiaceae bacterium]